MPIEKLKPTFSLDEERICALEQIVPEAFADGMINWETLREVLRERVEEDDAGTEHFGLFWPGKREARRLAAQPSKGTLVPAPGEGVDEETTENIFVEGDNLEVLKLLQKSYAGRITMIYIDPPYNTGNDFIYKDNFAEPLEDYLKKTGQMGEEGQLLTTNTKADGRFHTNWLNMLYPRMWLAKHLLTSKGLIFVSIDDNELHNLRQMMNEIFGEENYVNTVTITTKVAAGASGGGEDKRLKKNIEYLVIYARDYQEISGFANSFTEEPLLTVIENMRSEGQSWKYTSVLTAKGTKKKLQTISDGEGNPIDIYLREGIKRTTINAVCAAEKVSEAEAYKKYLSTIFSDTNAQTSIRTRVIESNPPLRQDQMYEVEYTPRSGRDKGKKVNHYYVSNTVRRVIWLSDVAYEKDGEIIKKERLGTLWDTFNYNNVGKEGGIPFPNGKKPVDLIKTCMSLVDDDEKNGIILDFFSGSGTTAQAVLEMNAKDRGSRRLICVQLPEPLEGINYANVFELGKARAKNVATQLGKEEASKLPLDRNTSLDLGFRVLRLSRSNFRAWREYHGDDLHELETLFSKFETPLVDGWKQQDVLTEILLLEGFPLNSKVARAPDFSPNEVVQVESDFSKHRLFICLEPSINDKTIERLAVLPDEDIFICLDSALNDAAKVRLNDVGNVRTI
jgi:adenine-specific DNA-methyltransferase